MRPGRSRAAPREVEVRDVERVPREGRAHGRHVGDHVAEHRVVEREDAQRAADVEAREGATAGDASLGDGVAEAQQDARDEEAAQHEEEHHAGSPRSGAAHPRLRGQQVRAEHPETATARSPAKATIFPWRVHFVTKAEDIFFSSGSMCLLIVGCDE